MRKIELPCSMCMTAKRHRKSLCIDCNRIANKKSNSRRAKVKFSKIELLSAEVDGIVYIEEWRDIPKWTGLYQASTFGRIKTKERFITKKDGRRAIIQEKLRALVPSGNGYLKVILYKNGVGYSQWVHILIAKTFIANPENKKQVNHKFGIKVDNRVSKLEWATYAEDREHCEKVLGHIWGNGIRHSGKTHVQSKPIKQIDIKTGNVIKIWDCVSDVIRAKITRNASMCALGKLNSSGGFKWEYA